MYAFKLSCAGVATLALCLHAFAAEPASSLSEADQIWSKLSDADRAKFQKQHGLQAVPSKTAGAPVAPKATKVATQSALAVKMPVAGSGNTAATGAGSVTNNIFGSCPGFGFFLRKNWTDIDLLSCPTDASKATGALLSYSDDWVKRDTTWSAIGTAALIYAPGNGFSTGVYTSVDKVTNSASAQASSNANQIGFGGFLQYGVVNAPLNSNVYSANYFRLRAGAVEDNIKNTTNANIIAEWIPVYYDLDEKIGFHAPIPIPGTAAVFRIDPEILAEYVDVTGKKQTSSFNTQTEALPVGPQVTLRLYPGTSDFWAHFVPTLSYWLAYEPYSGRSISWLDDSLAYNLDKDGHLALSFSYQRGNNVDTAGTFTKMYLVSLTGKI
jgi:hypothetical protein